MRSLVPRVGRSRERMPARRGELEPLVEFQREVNRLFDDFFGDLPLWRQSDSPGRSEPAFWPRVDVSENDKGITVSAELPGMDEKDIKVELQDDAVIIRGERKEEQEEKGKDWFRKEQSYGSFRRVIPLPAGVEGEKAKAKFKKGLLTVKMPKKAGEESKRKLITIEGE